MKKFVTIVGSRETPSEALSELEKIGKFLAERKWWLRSGGADGADAAGERGFLAAGSKSTEIYLPWRHFNGHSSELCSIPAVAFEIAKRLHPNWAACGSAAKLLHGRNILQVLGQNLDKPSNLLVCWTPKGEAVSGTRTAIILAQEYKVPIINIAVTQFPYQDYSL